jgi:hypothetical protein
VGSVVLIAAFLAQSECHVGPQQAQEVVRAAQVARVRYGLPEGLLLAVVLAETGGRDVMARGRGKGRVGCDVGVAQIHVPGCFPDKVAQVRPLLQNLIKSAEILSWSRSRCSKSPGWSGCKYCLWGRYNPGSRTWCKKVLRIWERLRRAPNA